MLAHALYLDLSGGGRRVIVFVPDVIYLLLFIYRCNESTFGIVVNHHWDFDVPASVKIEKNIVGYDCFFSCTCWFILDRFCIEIAIFIVSIFRHININIPIMTNKIIGKSHIVIILGFLLFFSIAVISKSY